MARRQGIISGPETPSQFLIQAGRRRNLPQRPATPRILESARSSRTGPESRTGPQSYFLLSTPRPEPLQLAIAPWPLPEFFEIDLPSNRISQPTFAAALE